MNDVKIFANVIEETAKEQIELLSQQKSFCDQKIRIMPDVHAGKGCVIGFTATVSDYVIPNVVGVDIGCGMLTVELGKKEINLTALDKFIYQAIPSGKDVYDDLMFDLFPIEKLRCYNKLINTNRIRRGIGTLGGGNHFIEIDKDEEGNQYLIIHTGSRNLGKQVAEYYQNLAHSALTGNDELGIKNKRVDNKSQKTKPV